MAINRTRRNLKRAAVGGLLASALALTSCGSGSDDKGDSNDNGDKKEISIGLVDGWAEGVAVTNLWKSVLEDEGYKVKVEKLDVAVMYTALAKGDIDVYLDAWLPVTHKDYVEKNKDNLVDLGTWFDKGTNAISVNEDSPAKSIADLKKMGKEYGNKLVGIEPGAGLTKLTKQAIKDYGLDDWDFVTSSSPAMLSELKKADKDNKNIAVTLWHPHWAYSKYPVRDLEDPKGSMGDPEKMKIYAHKGFEDDFPELTKKFKDFEMNDDQISELLENMYAGDDADEEKGVEEWVGDDKNKDFIDSMKN